MLVAAPHPNPLPAKELRLAVTGLPEGLAAVAVRDASGVELWIANLRSTPIAMPMPAAAQRLVILDAARCGAALNGQNDLENGQPIREAMLNLDAYAVARFWCELNA